MSYKHKIISLTAALMASSAFANVQVVDDSQNYAYNNHSDQYTTFAASKEQPVKQDESETEKYQLLLSKIEQMQQEILELRGQVELQAHQLKVAGLASTKGKVVASVPTMEAPVKQAEAAKPAVQPEQTQQQEAKSAVVATAASEQANEAKAKVYASADPMDEQLSYVAAYEHIKHRQYQKALPALQTFVATYPDGPYAANAHYWLGELYLNDGQLQDARSQFEVVVKDFTDSNKVASAQYKLGITYERLGFKDKAQAQFLKVTEEFPGTAISRLAKAKIS